MLEAVSTDTAERIVTLINFAAHPIMIHAEHRQVSSSYVHYLREHAEKTLIAPVVYINGAIGDASPINSGDDDDYQNAEIYGTDIADQALSAMADSQPVSDGLAFTRREFTADVDNWVLSLAYSFGALEANMSGPFWNRKVTNSVSYFSLGEQVQAVTMPGEALTRSALPVKQRMAAPAKLFLGLNGGCLGYFVPSDEWKVGLHDNYEESVSMGAHIADQLRDLLIEMIPNK